MYLNRFLENRCSYVRHILRDALSTKFEELLRCHVKKMLTYLRKMFAGPSDQFLRILYRPPPSHQCFCLLYGGPLGSIFSLTIWGFLIEFLRILYGAPQVSFFVYYMGAPLSSVFFAYYMGPPRASFFAFYIGAPQINFFAYYKGPPPDQFLCILYGSPPQTNYFTWGSTQINLFAYYVRPP